MCQRLLQRLRIGIGSDEFHPTDALVDHVLYRIATGATNTDNLDHGTLRRSLEHIDFHDISFLNLQFPVDRHHTVWRLATANRGLNYIKQNLMIKPNTQTKCKNLKQNKSEEHTY